MDFNFHKLNPQGIDKSKHIADLFNELLTSLTDVCPDSREFSIAKTKLEEACFFAKKAMAIQPENQAV